MRVGDLVVLLHTLVNMQGLDWVLLRRDGELGLVLGTLANMQGLDWVQLRRNGVLDLVSDYPWIKS